MILEQFFGVHIFGEVFQRRIGWHKEGHRPVRFDLEAFWDRMQWAGRKLEPTPSRRSARARAWVKASPPLALADSATSITATRGPCLVLEKEKGEGTVGKEGQAADDVDEAVGGHPVRARHLDALEGEGAVRVPGGDEPVPGEVGHHGPLLHRRRADRVRHRQLPHQVWRISNFMSSRLIARRDTREAAFLFANHRFGGLGQGLEDVVGEGENAEVGLGVGQRLLESKSVAGKEASCIIIEPTLSSSSMRLVKMAKRGSPDRSSQTLRRAGISTRSTMFTRPPSVLHAHASQRKPAKLSGT